MPSWRAQPGPQTLALQVPDSVNELLFGGARGGGKTDTGMVWMAEHVKNPLYRGLVIRKHATDLRDWADRAARMYQGLGVKMAYRPWEFYFPSGAKIVTGHLKDEMSYTQWMGQEFQRVLIEELTQLPDQKRYLQLRSANRSTVPGIRAQTFATTNPGGIGHVWVKKRFIEPASPYTIFTDTKEQLRRVYIAATIDDNPALSKADPDYVKQLEALKFTDPDLWRAWRLGDWNIIAGQAFREWSDMFHIVPRFDIPLAQCKRFIGFDWGYNAPGVALWIAITPENRWGVKRIYVYRELMLQHTEPREWARQLDMIRKIDGVRHMWLPHDCFNKEMGESIAEIFRTEGHMNVRPAGTLNKGARHMRKAIMHSVLADARDGRPILQVRDTCKYLSETIPQLIGSDNDPEDINTEGPDHAYDALTEALLMETPHFARSSAIRQTNIINPVKTSPFTIMPDESILPPDIIGAVKAGTAGPSRRSTPR